MTSPRFFKPPVFAVIGAGHGGLAMAGHLGIMGLTVRLFNRSSARLEAVMETGCVKVDGAISGTGRVSLATTVMSEAITGADIIMVVVPATAHRDIAVMCAPHLRDGQVVVLNPGRTFGALEFHQVLVTRGCTADVTIAEAQTFLYAARAMGPGHAHVFGVKHAVPVASIRAHRIPQVLDVLHLAFPQFVPGDSVFRTSFDNIGAVFHPALCVLNAGRIENVQDFQFYTEGVTQSVARVLEQVDSERVQVAAALGFRATTTREWLYLAYHAMGDSLYQAMHAHPGYRGITAPKVLSMRYITEDVPASLVPIASIGRKFGVATPTIDAIIHTASVLTGADYWMEGRTVERLGIASLDLRDLRLLAIGEDRHPEQLAAAPVIMIESRGVA